MKEKEAFEREPGVPESVSVYDFLYHDARRVGSFLAQFDDNGHLQQIKEGDSSARTSSLKIEGNAEGKFLEITKLAGKAERTSAKEGRQNSERIYDPLWTNARSLLDFLYTNEMICNDITDARIGDIVLVTGSLGIIDYGFMKPIWKLPFVKKQISDGAYPNVLHSMRLSEADQNIDQLKKASRERANQIPEMISDIPHTIQSYIVCNDGKIAWSILNEYSMIPSSTDIILKYGACIPGEWRFLGVLDVIPETDYNAKVYAEKAHSVHQAILSTPMGREILGVLPILRVMGMPNTAYGLTPIMIFREVSAVKS